MVFVIAGFLGFATGTSWGTMALLAVCSAGGYLLMGIMKRAVVPFIIALSLLIISIFVLDKISKMKDPIDYSKVNY